MTNNSRLSAFLCGLGTGAALLWFFDPKSGARRRSLLRDKAVALTNDVSDAIGNRATDLKNRAYGVIAETSKSITGKPIDEQHAADQLP